MNLTRVLLRGLLGGRLARTSGTLSLPGLEAPLTIRRDRYGIPHIEAETDADAWFGLGFCQAQDRAFQLEMRLRTVRGTLSALFGPRTLAIDRLSRRIGFVDSADRQLALTDDGPRAQVEAFVRGVNAGLATSPRAHEFVLLRARPTQWTAADVLGFGKLMSFLLIGNWDVELARLKILLSDGPQALRDLDPVFPADQAVAAAPAVPAGPAVDRLGEDISAFLAFTGAGGGSNAWAIAGSRTASARPILASDPHLAPGMPAHWYLAHLRTPRWSAAGASLVGAPMIGIGHNGFAAWGVTAGMVDQVDLFVEEVGSDGASVRRGEGYEPCERRREVIQVKGASPVIEEVLITRRGPIIGPALAGDLGAISLRAVWLDAKPVRGLLNAHRSRSFESFRAEFTDWPLTSQNVVYADVSGRIAWQLVGEAPRRRKGWGTLPLPASDPASGWHDEPVPFDEMPCAVEPPSAFIVNANDRPPTHGEGPYLGVDWLDHYRGTRISELLAARSDWDRESASRLQLDQTTLAWREVRAAVLAAPARSDAAQRALDLLGAWDGELAVDSAAATVFQLFVAEIWRRVAQARAPNSWRYALSQGFDPILQSTTFATARASRLLSRLVQQPAGWFQRSWPDEIADCLASAVRDLRARHGPDERAWGWGRVRPLTLAHPVGAIKLLAPVLNRGPFPCGGDSNTVSQAGVSPLNPVANPGAIASLRFVVEVGDWENASFVLPGGQSGNPFSRHYDDLLPLWRRGEGVPIAWAPEAVAAATVTTLRLQPI